ncbi:RHS repeat-associated core domain-containing protein [Kordia sp.]|uniref:RHS repeat-associated core domain-containing protein n=1 Tax=Kordia sp. TaxID=1965332 RepID=UPI003D2C13E4
MYKKILLFFLLLCSQHIYSQCTNDCVPRWGLATYVYDRVYDYNNPDNYPSINYPVPFLDLYSSNPTIDKKIRVLSYLDYNDGITVLSHLSSNGYFLPTGTVSRYEALAVIMEAWDIQPDYTGSVPFNDIGQSNPYFGYINEADDRNFLDGLFGSNFNGNYGITFNEMQTIISRVMNSNFHPVSNSTLLNPSNYFMPNNYTPQNLGMARGLEQGVFSHYAKNSFVIPDRKLNLNFSHYYSTQMVELPESYFPIKPLGRGWTHTYNSYVIREDNVGEDSVDYYYIVWADGTIHIFNEDDEEYVSKGVYDDFDELNNDRLRIEKKDQTRYYFEKLDNDQKIYYLVEVRDKNGNEINIEYQTSDVDNDFERIEYVEAPSGKRLNFYYHNNTDLIDYIDDPIGRVIRFTYNEERLKNFYDAKDQRTRYYYVSNDEGAPEQHQYKRFLLRKIRLPENNTIEAEYDDDEDGKLEHYTINNNEAVDVDVQFHYGDSNPITADVSVPMPNGGNQNYHYEFNGDGMITQFQDDVNDLDITYPSSSSSLTPLLPTNVDLNGLDIDYEYDDRGNVTEIQKEGITDEDFWYDNDNNLIRYEDANGNNTYFNYDNNSNLTSIEDALGHYVSLTYDNYGQLTSITNQEGITVNYTYENDGAVSTITAPENLTSSFTYDGVNRMLTKTINGLTSSYTYDPNDNLNTQTNSIGLTTSFNYDENDNMVSIINANNIETSFTYNDKDQLTSETFGSLVKQYIYNDDGTLDKYIKPSGAEIEYDYLSDGKLNGVGTITDLDYYGSGKRKDLIKSIATNDIRYNFDYDPLNRLDEVVNDDTNETVTYDYDDVGNITKITYPNSSSGVSVEARYTYDVKNRLIRVRARINGSNTTIAEYQYRNDDLINNIIYGNGITTYFFYDEAGRKTGVNHTGVNNNPLYKEAIEIDNRGNIINQGVEYEVAYEHLHFSPNTNEQNFSYNENNHIEGSYSFNDDGNLISDGYATHTYNIDDQLISRSASSENFSFTYDAYGNRVSKTHTPNLGTRRYIWDILAQNIIQETNASGSNVLSNHIYGLGLEASISSTGFIRYYHGDLRGNVVVVSNQDGERIRDYVYDDFGNVKRFSVGYNPDNNPFTFLGKYGIIEDDGDKGLYYIRARYYDASIGRFLTQDPIWSTNLYPYADNNPISKIDRNGKFVETALDVISLGMSANDFNNDPSLTNGLFLAWDLVSLIPGVPGSWALRGLKYGNKLIGSNTLARSAYKAVGEITTSIKNQDLLNHLNSSSKGNWVKVYEAGILKGKKVEMHFFRNNNTGEIFDLKKKYDYWHQQYFNKL